MSRLPSCHNVFVFFSVARRPQTDVNCFFLRRKQNWVLIRMNGTNKNVKNRLNNVHKFSSFNSRYSIRIRTELFLFLLFLRTLYRKRAHSIQSPSSNGKKSWSEVKTWPKNDPAGRIYGWYRAGWLHIFTWPVCQCVCVCGWNGVRWRWADGETRRKRGESVVRENARENLTTAERPSPSRPTSAAGDRHPSFRRFLRQLNYVSPSRRPCRESLESAGPLIDREKLANELFNNFH